MLRLVEFTKEVLAQKRVRLIGVCFGHQITGRALGAPVVRSEKGFELSVIDLNLTARGKEIFDGKNVLVRLAPPPLAFPLNSAGEYDFSGKWKKRCCHFRYLRDGHSFE